MQYLIISDVHGNLPALELVLKKEHNNYDAIISLGDVVNYAPWSNECVQLMALQPNTVQLLGNHETYFIEGAYSNSGKISETFFNVIYPTFTEHDTIKKYQQHTQINDIEFVHTINNSYVFKDTQIAINKNYCIGHSHQQYKNELNNYTIFNPGSVGQNRALINVICYAMFNSVTNEFTNKQILYDVDIVINEMKAKNFPKECINYYNQKNRL